MHFLDFVNVLIVVLAALGVWYQWQLYRLIRSVSFLLLGVGLAYLVVYRIVLPFYPWISRYGLALPFYVLIVIKGRLLLRDLRRVLGK